MHTMDNPRYAQATVRRVLSRRWAVAGRPMDCLGGDDVVHDVTTVEVFSVGQCFASFCAMHAKHFPP
jgi:hypothetical protein